MNFSKKTSIINLWVQFNSQRMIHGAKITLICLLGLNLIASMCMAVEMLFGTAKNYTESFIKVRTTSFTLSCVIISALLLIFLWNLLYYLISTYKNYKLWSGLPCSKEELAINNVETYADYILLLKCYMIYNVFGGTVISGIHEKLEQRIKASAINLHLCADKENIKKLNHKYDLSKMNLDSLEDRMKSDLDDAADLYWNKYDFSIMHKNNYNSVEDSTYRLRLIRNLREILKFEVTALCIENCQELLNNSGVNININDLKITV